MFEKQILINFNVIYLLTLLTIYSAFTLTCVIKCHHNICAFILLLFKFRLLNFPLGLRRGCDMFKARNFKQGRSKKFYTHACMFGKIALQM